MLLCFLNISFVISFAVEFSTFLSFKPTFPHICNVNSLHNRVSLTDRDTALPLGGFISVSSKAKYMNIGNQFSLSLTAPGFNLPLM